MHWVGVPIILTSNSYHANISKEPYTKDWYFNDKIKKDCIEQEEHRIAFYNRMNVIELNFSHSGGKCTFPYKAEDLAFYFKYLSEEPARSEANE